MTNCILLEAVSSLAWLVGVVARRGEVVRRGLLMGVDHSHSSRVSRLRILKRTSWGLDGDAITGCGHRCGSRVPLLFDVDRPGEVPRRAGTTSPMLDLKHVAASDDRGRDVADHADDRRAIMEFTKTRHRLDTPDNKQARTVPPAQVTVVGLVAKTIALLVGSGRWVDEISHDPPDRHEPAGRRRASRGSSSVLAGATGA